MANVQPKPSGSAGIPALVTCSVPATDDEDGFKSLKTKAWPGRISPLDDDLLAAPSEVWISEEEIVKQDVAESSKSLAERLTKLRPDPSSFEKVRPNGKGQRGNKAGQRDDLELDAPAALSAEEIAALAAKYGAQFPSPPRPSLDVASPERGEDQPSLASQVRNSPIIPHLKRRRKPQHHKPEKQTKELDQEASPARIAADKTEHTPERRKRDKQQLPACVCAGKDQADAATPDHKQAGTRPRGKENVSPYASSHFPSSTHSMAAPHSAQAPPDTETVTPLCMAHKALPGSGRSSTQPARALHYPDDDSEEERPSLVKKRLGFGIGAASCVEGEDGTTLAVACEERVDASITEKSVASGASSSHHDVAKMPVTSTSPLAEDTQGRAASKTKPKGKHKGKKSRRSPPNGKHNGQRAHHGRSARPSRQKSQTGSQHTYYIYTLLLDREAIEDFGPGARQDSAGSETNPCDQDQPAVNYNHNRKAARASGRKRGKTRPHSRSPNSTSLSSPSTSPFSPTTPSLDELLRRFSQAGRFPLPLLSASEGDKAATELAHSCKHMEGLSDIVRSLDLLGYVLVELELRFALGACFVHRLTVSPANAKNIGSETAKKDKQQDSNQQEEAELKLVESLEVQLSSKLAQLGLTVSLAIKSEQEAIEYHFALAEQLQLPGAPISASRRAGA